MRTPRASSHAMRQRRPGTLWFVSVSEIVNSPYLGLRGEASSICVQQPALNDYVFERADRVDGDANAIAAGQREGIRRNNACAGHQIGAGREVVFAEEILDKNSWPALELGKSRGA